ncbi:HWE histidine kinase domain-containing protein [Sphingomonas sp. PvP056]|uniref:HWE histidine kinase domain-containing protein n=1 Tax=Sphingomonas sp. PvP056 TaxID=3156392 RepID=UPI003390F6AB
MPALDRQPLPPAPLKPYDAPPEVRSAIDAFVGRLDPNDPIVAAFDGAIVPMVVTDPTLPDNPLIYVNPAFERLTGFAAEEAIGRNCRFMQGPLTEEADVKRLREAIAKRERIEIDLLNHHRDGTPFWNRLIVSPVFDAAGQVRYFVASQLDVTLERHRMIQLEQDRETLAAAVAAREVDLAEREARLKLALRAGGLGTWTLDPVTQELTASRSCKANFGCDPNAPLTYADILQMIHPADLAGQQAAVTSTVETGVPLAIEYRILTPAGDQRWIAIRGEMQYRADGTPLLMSGFSTDISERKFAEEHRTILARELTHRVKNTLATVGAVVSQTLRDAASLADARVTVAGRIASLGAAHELLVRDEVDGAVIGDIVERVLAPFVDRNGKRIVVGGPSIRLSPEVTLALSMALHELATNAIKYGALSNADGSVDVRWALQGSDGDRHFRFAWVEHGGPCVTAPTRTGFGSRMIERVLSRHVRGEAKLSYLPAGVRFEIEAPI